MFIRLTCQSCGIRFKVNIQHAGKRGRCPAQGCGCSFSIPDEAKFKALQTKQVENSDNLTGKLVINQNELDRLADELAEKLGWNDTDDVSDGLANQNESGNLNSSYLQPCGVMPLEAIEYLRKQNKIGVCQNKENKKSIFNQGRDFGKCRFSNSSDCSSQ